jgi:hypothetical protein
VGLDLGIEALPHKMTYQAITGFVVIRVRIDGNHRHFPLRHQQRQGIVHGSRGFATVVPGDGRILAHGTKPSGKRHHEHGQTAGQNDVFRRGQDSREIGIMLS